MLPLLISVNVCDVDAQLPAFHSHPDLPISVQAPMCMLNLLLWLVHAHLLLFPLQGWTHNVFRVKMAQSRVP